LAAPGSSKVSITATPSSPTTNPALAPALPPSLPMAAHIPAPNGSSLKSGAGAFAAIAKPHSTTAASTALRVCLITAKCYHVLQVFCGRGRPRQASASDAGVPPPACLPQKGVMLEALGRKPALSLCKEISRALQRALKQRQPAAPNHSINFSIFLCALCVLCGEASRVVPTAFPGVHSQASHFRGLRGTMVRCILLFALILAMAFEGVAQDRSYGRSMVITDRGIVATSQYLASQAGAQILAHGGSAVDAAIAANAVLGVTEPMMNGIGGDLFLIYWDAKTGKLYGLNSSG